jgi:UDP-N-acetylglucosamine transferase subunit ALG13
MSFQVFVTVGTDHHRFDRLITWIDEWLNHLGDDAPSCFVQHGTSDGPSVAIGEPYVTHDRMESLLREATIVVSHGGPSTIADAWKAGHRPIVLPRDDRLGEHVDDHQMKFAARMAAAERIHFARSLDDLGRLLAEGMADAQMFRNGAGVQETAAVVARFEALVETLLRPPSAKSH